MKKAPGKIVVVMAALMLTACGGGGSSTPTTPAEPDPVQPPQPEPEANLPFPPTPTTPAEPDPVQPPQPEPEANLPFPHTPTGSNDIAAWNLRSLPLASLAHITRQPVYSDGEYLHVGVDQQLSHVPVVGNERGYEVRRGRLSDGTDAGILHTYLDAALSGNLSKFAEAPTVRFVGSSTESELVDRTLSAISLVNAALPVDSRIRVATRTPIASVGNATNTIYIKFEDTLSSAGNTRTTGNADGTLRSASITLNRDSQFGSDNNLFAVHLVAHELLHALGMRGHQDDAMRSIMPANNGIFHLVDEPVSTLHPADREALRGAMYGRLSNGDNASDLGPWNDMGTHLVGNGAHNAFGSVWRNGYAEPWAYGPQPTTALQDNASLTGTATWDGLLLGWSHVDGSAISGDAELTVNLASLDGTAAFTKLANMQSGAQWGDGDLQYQVDVNGNAFHSTGGDSGTVTGIFTGAAHEGAAGTLERSDLTAAFGASLQ